MPIAQLDNLKSELKTLDDLVTRTLDGASDEERDLSEAETETLTTSQARMGVITPQIELINSTQESRSSALDLANRSGVGSSSTQVSERSLAGPQSGGRSLGDMFVASDVFRDYRGGGRSPGFDIEIGEDRSVLTTTSTPVGAVFMPEPQKIMFDHPGVDYPLLGAIRDVPVSSGSVDVVTYGSREGAKTPAKVAEAAVKPEVVVTAATQTLTLDLYAGWLQVTRQLLQDAPAVRAFIDSELRRGLMTLREKNVVAALGAAAVPAVTGAANQPTWEIIRGAIASVQVAGYRPNGVLMNPTDAGTMDLDMIKAAGGWSTAPIAGLSPWGLQVITSPAVAAGKVYVGDFNAGITLFRRTGIEIFITDSHEATFTSNVFTILGEERYVPAVVRADALAEVKLHA